jgi:TonB family protein
MQIPRILFLCLAVSTSAFSQTTPSAAPATPELPKDPREVFAMAAPFYDYNAADLKPWHLHATYQLYDEKGNPTEQGTYEYWWVSPQMSRSSWSRPGATHTDWHTGDGKHAYEDTGERLNFFEYKLQSMILSPLPSAAEIDRKGNRLDRRMVSVQSGKIPCIMIIPELSEGTLAETVPLGMFPTYCFDSKLPVLRMSNSLGTLAMEFNKIVKVQNHFLPEDILFLEGTRKILSATIDKITKLDPGEPALTPSVGVHVAKQDKAVLAAGISTGMLIKKVVPVYPEDAQRARISGRVILKALIGRDGRIHDLQVISAPLPSLAGSALWAVSRWEYTPYLLNGEPVEVETTINVIFSLNH